MRVTRWRSDRRCGASGRRVHVVRQRAGLRAAHHGAKLALRDSAGRAISHPHPATGVECGYQRDRLLYVCIAAATPRWRRRVRVRRWSVRMATGASHWAGTRAIALRSRHRSIVVGGTLAVSDARAIHARSRTLAVARVEDGRHCALSVLAETVTLNHCCACVRLSWRRMLANWTRTRMSSPSGPKRRRSVAMGRRVYIRWGFSLTVPVRDASKVGHLQFADRVVPAHDGAQTR